MWRRARSRYDLQLSAQYRLALLVRFCLPQWAIECSRAIDKRCERGLCSRARIPEPRRARTSRRAAARLSFAFAHRAEYSYISGCALRKSRRLLRASRCLVLHFQTCLFSQSDYSVVGLLVDGYESVVILIPLIITLRIIQSNNLNYYNNMRLF